MGYGNGISLNAYALYIYISFHSEVSIFFSIEPAFLYFFYLLMQLALLFAGALFD